MPKVPTTQDAQKYKPKDIGLKERFLFSFGENMDINSMSVCEH